jgi:hypothetical protein
MSTLHDDELPPSAGTDGLQKPEQESDAIAADDNDSSQSPSEVAVRLHLLGKLIIPPRHP